MTRRVAVVLAVLATLVLPVGAAGAAQVQIRHADFGLFPQVRVTVLLPNGVTPGLYENGRRASYASVHQLGAADALLLAVDNSSSMTGTPLREAKRAAKEFLGTERRASSTGLVSFGHEALALTRPNEATDAVVRTLNQLEPDPQTGTALYDALVSSAKRLQGMSAGSKVLVLLTDGHDLGSHASLQQAVDAAQHAGVIVYAIAAGTRADRATLAQLAGETGGRLFDANDVSQLGATYAALSRELDRTWQISYLSRARPGDSVTLALHAGATTSAVNLRVPGEVVGNSGPLPAFLADGAAGAALVVLVCALLLAVAGAVVIRRSRKPEIVRLLQPHVRHREEKHVKDDVSGRLDALTVWTESALADLPGSERLAQAVERSGMKIRIGHVPYIALASAFVLEILGTIMGAGPLFGVILLLVGLALPFIVFGVAAGRRRKAFDRQLPDVLATIASTLRAGHGLRVALRAVADDGSPPASEEFNRVLHEERFGRPLHEGIAAMCERIGSPDLDYVATAINVQSQAGGSLASLFDTLSETVRERQRHARKVRALTSMGRASALILICLPFALAALMTFISPAYMKPFYTSSTGHVLIVGCLISMSIGGLLLKRIVTVRY
jgi:tight adherence protein B